MILRFYVVRPKPGMEEEFVRYTWERGFPAILAQPGCRSMQRLRRLDDPGEFVVASVWDSLEALEAFKRTPLR